MLTNMFVGLPAGNYDRILDFSTAVTGCLFFVPSADFLDDLPGPPAQPAGAVLAPPGAEPPAGVALPPAGEEPRDGSLGIGALRIKGAFSDE